jgi:uncharacterized protein HemX
VKKIILFVLVLGAAVVSFAQDSTRQNQTQRVTSGRQDKKAEKRQRINALIKQE